MINKLQIPSFAEEKMLEAQGYHHIAGIDEVGRGALAGPVVAAAVILPYPIDTPWLAQVKDSKQLSPAKRELLFHHIHETAISIGIGMAPSEVIDAQGIIRATRLAMKLAVDQLSPLPQSLLIDYMLLPEVPLPQKGITNGDSLCLSIACASIMAKVARDHLMIELDKTYPSYGLAQHKGYGTREHLACLHRLGPSPIHRQSFKPVKDMSHSRLVTYPPDPLPLLREGGSAGKRGASPLSKVSFPSCKEDIPIMERGIKGVRLQIHQEK